MIKNHIFFINIIILAIFIGCQNQSTSTKKSEEYIPVVVTPLETDISSLSASQSQNLRLWLDTFYDGDSEIWQQSRKKILGLGPVGMEALSIFMVKFFFGGNQNIPAGFRNEDINSYWERAREELAQLKSVSVPYIVAAMAHPNMGTTGKMQCSMTLVKIGQPAISDLVTNLERGNRSFRRIAIETLANIGDPEVVPSIAKIYLESKQPSSSDVEIQNDASFDLRYYAIKALGKLQDTEGLPALEKALEDKNSSIVEQSLQSLLLYEDPAALPILQKALIKCRASEFIAYQNRIQRRIDLLKTRL